MGEGVGRRAFCGIAGVFGLLGVGAVKVLMPAKDGSLKCECGSYEFATSHIQTFQPRGRCNLIGDVGHCTCVKCGERYIIEHGSRNLRMLNGPAAVDAVKSAVKEWTA